MAPMIFNTKPMQPTMRTSSGEVTTSTIMKRSIDWRNIDRANASRNTPLKNAPIHRLSPAIGSYVVHTDEFGAMKWVCKALCLGEKWGSRACAVKECWLTCCPRSWSCSDEIMSVNHEWQVTSTNIGCGKCDGTGFEVNVMYTQESK